MGRLAEENDQIRAGFVAGLGASMDFDDGPIKAEPGPVVQEIIERADAFDIVTHAPSLSGRPIFAMIGERDETLPKAQHHDPFVAALREAGAERLTEVVVDDDHSFSAHRVALARGLVDWVDAECWP